MAEPSTHPPINPVQETQPLPWHASLPQPVSKPERISCEELKALMEGDLINGKDYIVVDVRRTDFEDGFIKGALNLPAHSFYQTLPAIVAILGHIPRVIFHCNNCGPTGRGPRTAGWYADKIAEIQGKSTALVLEGGIKQWLARYRDAPEFTVLL
ncbi:Rhodanese-like protein [Serendipita vermifera]|nr:Rhodanese-like protein [Serendipita vermifera]